MKKFKKINMLLSIDYFKTLWFNVKAFDFKTAMLFPVILGYGIKAKIDGKIRICGKVRFGMVKLGLSGSNDLKYYEQNKSYFSVEDGGGCSLFRITITLGDIFQSYAEGK